MRRFIITFLLVMFCLPFLVSAESPKKKALYFYSENCALCDEVEAYFSSGDLSDRHEIKRIDVSAPYNLEYLNRFFDVFKVEPAKRGWPVVILGEEMLVGSQSIITNFSSQIESASEEEFPTPEGISKKMESDEKKDNLDFGSNENVFSVGVFFGAAILDSFNPCALAVLVILLALMIFVRLKDKALLLGMFFILGIFLVYFLIGLSTDWFFPWVLKASKFISLGAAVILMAIGITKLLKIFSLNRYFNFQKNWSRNFAEILRNRGKLIEDRISHPIGSLVLGMLASFFLLPCAYRPYLTTTSILFSSHTASFGKFFLILVYNLFFALPMIILVAGIYFGSKNQRFSQWEEKNKKLVDALISGVLIFVGVYLIQNWL